MIQHCKGLYPQGDLGKISAIIGGRRPIIVPATLWVWPKIAGRSPGDRREITGQSPLPGNGGPPTYNKNV